MVTKISSFIVVILALLGIWFAFSWFTEKLQYRRVEKITDKDSLYTTRMNKMESRIDSLNLIISKKDSVLSCRIDSIKIRYNNNKAKLEKDEKNYNNTKSSIFFPKL